MAGFDRITSNPTIRNPTILNPTILNPTILNGQPTIRGMRVSVRRVIEALAVYPNWDDLRRGYPELNQKISARRSNSLRITSMKTSNVTNLCETRTALAADRQNIERQV